MLAKELKENSSQDSVLRRRALSVLYKFYRQYQSMECDALFRTDLVISKVTGVNDGSSHPSKQHVGHRVKAMLEGWHFLASAVHHSCD